MWILFAVLSAFFAGMTAILAKCGIRNTDSTVATAVRTGVVLLLSCGMVLVAGSGSTLSAVSARSILFLVLSGVATGASWLCYFRALQLGDVHRVTAIDKSSTVFVVILSVLFFHEPFSLHKAIFLVFMTAGILLMALPEKKEGDPAEKVSRGVVFYAVLSMIFAVLTTILAKVGIENVESNLATAIRTAVVLLMAWLCVFVTGKSKKVREIPKSELGFILLSGVATGASWLCYYKALRDGYASVVVPIDKMSVAVTVLFSFLVFHEKPSFRVLAGLFLFSAGAVLSAVFP